MKAIHILASASLLVLTASGCDQRLEVKNLTDPDIGRVFATGASIESTNTRRPATSEQARWPTKSIRASTSRS